MGTWGTYWEPHGNMVGMILVSLYDSRVCVRVLLWTVRND
jgi:hypothetical protein